MPTSLPEPAQRYTKEWLAALVAREKAKPGEEKGSQETVGKRLGITQSRVAAVLQTGKTSAPVFLSLAILTNRLPEALAALGVSRDLLPFADADALARAHARNDEQAKVIKGLEDKLAALSPNPQPAAAPSDASITHSTVRRNEKG
jgi:hypothetical protein